MESLKAWGMTVCFAALAAGMANIVAPKGNLEKSFRFAVSLFFLCCVLVPVFHLKNVNLNLNLPNASGSVNTEFQKSVDEQKLELSRDNVSSLIRDTCTKQGVTPLSVKADVTMDNKGAIAVNGATVTLKKADMGKKEAVVDAVKNDLGIQITVTEGES